MTRTKVTGHLGAGTTVLVVVGPVWPTMTPLVPGSGRFRRQIRVTCHE